jgi:hypothetical protein
MSMNADRVEGTNQKEKCEQALGRSGKARSGVVGLGLII